MFVAKDSMSEEIGWKRSLERSHKLVTDAVMLENDPNAGDSSEETQSKALSILPLSQHSDNDVMSLIRPNDSLVEPPNGALSVSHLQQKFYFSHTNSLHIGTSTQPSIHININNTHNTYNTSIHNTYNTNNITKSQDQQSEDIIAKTRSIASMMASNQPLNEYILDVIATHLGENWRSLFRFLDFSDGQIDQMKEDYYIYGVKEVIYRLLLDYSRNNDDASLGHITKLMWNLGFKRCVAILNYHNKRGDLVKNEKYSPTKEGRSSKGSSSTLFQCFKTKNKST